MVIDWDVPVAMDDGVVLRADVFRPGGRAGGGWTGGTRQAYLLLPVIPG